MAKLSRRFGLGAGVAAGAYAAYVASAWRGYGHPAPASADDRDDLLDGFMPHYDVVERHHLEVNAPAALTLAAAQEIDLRSSTLARAVFKGRELLMGAEPDTTERPRGLLAEVQSLGWKVLAEERGREVVVGAVTRPWEANPVFRGLPPGQFAAFAEPGYVKIAWTLRADPLDETRSIFRTETRALATDDAARRRFRPYWSFLSPGIVLIRWAMLSPVKEEAERRYAGPWSVVHGTGVTPRTSAAR